ncbi:MAG: hypothetical protein K0R40_2682 [Burkholderiales bacterium]|nr:hypothetical protein [Burkholderiales bacterium]
MDLGLTMLQRWWRRVYAPHLLVAVPVMAMAIAAGGFLQRAWVAILLVWWLKPLYDRVVLHVLSRAVFGELQSARAVLASPGAWLGTGLLRALTFGRIDTARSFHLPVRQLEGQAGRAARERSSVLGRRVGGYATWLTLACFILEVFVLFGSLGLLAELFLPAKAAEGKGLLEYFLGDEGDEDAPIFSFEDAFAYALAVLLFEPFYVAAGFALYLNRRTLLEGWDIEVALRRIAQRHATAIGLFFLAILLLPFAAPHAHAQDKDPRREIREVLSDQAFGYHKEVLRWQPRAKPEQRSVDTSWLRALGYALAKAGELVLWVAAGLLAAYAIWWAARMLPRARPGPPPEPYRPPDALFGMDLTPEKLPPDVGAAAAALAREGKLREALGLLYRGALSELVHKRGVQLLPSHTEGEAVRLARLPYFGSLVGAWQQCAYARRMPPAAEVERLAAEYRQAFG